MVTGASDNQLRVWSLEATEDGRDEEGGSAGVPTAGEGGEQQQQQAGRQNDDGHVVAVYMGSVTRQGNGKHMVLFRVSTYSANQSF